MAWFEGEEYRRLLIANAIAFWLMAIGIGAIAVWYITSDGGCV